jgi:hypothetical protein
MFISASKCKSANSNAHAPRTEKVTIKDIAYQMVAARQNQKAKSAALLKFHQEARH